MNTSTAIPFAAFALMSAAHLYGADHLLDAPSPGYFEQVERLSPPRQPAVLHTNFGPVVHIYIAPRPSLAEPLTGAEQPFSQPIRLFQQSPSLIKTGEGQLRVVPTPAKPR